MGLILCCTGVSTALFGVLHFSLAGSLVMMIFTGFFLEVGTAQDPCKML